MTGRLPAGVAYAVAGGLTVRRVDRFVQRDLSEPHRDGVTVGLYAAVFAVWPLFAIALMGQS